MSHTFLWGKNFIEFSFFCSSLLSIMRTPTMLHQLYYAYNKLYNKWSAKLTLYQQCIVKTSGQWFGYFRGNIVKCT